MVYASCSYDKVQLKHGYTHQYLHVDLTTHTITVRPVPETMQRFVGGRGYCLWLVHDGTNAGTRYDSPENVLALAGGPFCGETGFVGTGKFITGTISPLTGTFCDSNVGGYFFPLVKLAGFDAIAVTGRSERQVVIVIDGNRHDIRIKAAPQTDDTLICAEQHLESWRGDSRPENTAFVCAGQGARKTFFGCINSVYYDLPRKRCRSKQAGRGGTGTVMRDKGLWGIVVSCDAPKGNSNHPQDRERLRSAGRNLRNVVRQVDPQAMSLGTQGTTVLVDMMDAHHLLPINNYQFGSDARHRHVSGNIFEQEVFKQKVPDGCFAGCNLACTKGCESHRLTTGPHSGRIVAVDGPEYETVAAITNLGIFDLGTVLEYSFYCDEYGMDTISSGVCMSFLFECYERGLLTAEDAGGLELTWGNSDAAMELLHRMAGETDDFARSAGRGLRTMKSWVARRVAARLGRGVDELLAELSLFGMECKGLEFSMYITKESLAQQGGYGFALKGPQHDESWLIAIDQLHNELPTFKHKAEALRWFPLIRTWFNIVGLCKLPWIDVRHPKAKDTDDPAKNMPTLEYYLDLVNGTLGTEKTIDDLLEDSERCYLLHKLINLRQGFGTREHDQIPLRAMAPVFDQEYQSRKAYYEQYLREVAGIDPAGLTDAECLRQLQAFRRQEYVRLTEAVYQEKGYDSQGIPLEETLERLGMAEEPFLGIVRHARALYDQTN